MTLVEEYELEIEFEHDAAPSTAPGEPVRPRARARAGLGIVARRMRAAPLVVLFVASVAGFAAFRSLVGFIVGMMAYPEILADTIGGAATSEFDGAFLQVFGLMMLAALAGFVGAVAVFWKRRIGWALLVVFAIWQVVGPWVIYTLLFSRMDLPAGVVPSWWSSRDLADWIRMGTTSTFLGLLFVPSVLRWVIAKPDGGAAARPASASTDTVSASSSQPWSVGSRAL